MALGSMVKLAQSVVAAGVSSLAVSSAAAVVSSFVVSVVVSVVSSFVVSAGAASWLAQPANRQRTMTAARSNAMSFFIVIPPNFFM